ncbi:MAG: pyruvate kinase [Gammaproteobacteria bacterium]|nr:pyruvate kinase [Gammaproteobacteria bacterium]MDJ0871447.1 pyruvate kinase [Gammaproteobacteria bacterium]MDJ0892598.1 pyruvate kinase [Gammaproteobacteria bacterium]
MAPAARLRKTKIVATVGPACDTVETLAGMLAAGMNVARLNLSYGSFPEHAARLERIREAARRAQANVAIMIDTRGIEIRTGRLASGSVELTQGSDFWLHTDGRPGDASQVSVTYRDLPDEVNSGVPILLDDGAIELEVRSVSPGEIRCRVVHGGVLGENKSVNLPETELSLSAVSPENRDDVVQELSFALEHDVDYIAASFVQTADDIARMREILLDRGAPIPIIAKIENKAGVANLDQIVEAADGVMVARGDLGVELPLAEVPGTQKKIIRTTVMKGKPVITATQMLASMERNPKPTRAEASDVANAILDGTSAIMLSGETAAGRYPVEAVRTMATLAQRAEASLREYGYLQKILPHPSQVVTEAVSQAAVRMAEQLKAAAIFSLTETGFTSRLISKHRPDCPILAITASKLVARKLCMNWGVVPIRYTGERSDEAKIEFAIARAMELGYVRAGDTVVATAGYQQQAGGTDLIRVITLSG